VTLPLWNRVTVVGCGLIGASFALGLKKTGVCNSVAGWDCDPRVLDEAFNLGIIDEKDSSFSSQDSPSLSELFYLAMPVNGIIAFLRDCGSQIPPGAVVTDAGSTKTNVCDVAQTYFPPGNSDRYFIAGHPVAGSHFSGLSHARADLFEGAPYVLIADDNDDSAPLRKVKEAISRLGARIHLMSAREHDRAMALLSHLPQLLSNALSSTAAERLSQEEVRQLAGNGYHDMTRQAGSSWSIWADIFASNSAPLADVLDSLLERLRVVRDELREPGDFPELSRLFGQPQPPTRKNIREP
jgi:prephenate dehydrogenase